MRISGRQMALDDGGLVNDARPDSRCGNCGWPLEDTPALSVHRTSQGLVCYRRCQCGRISVQCNGDVLGGAGPKDRYTRAASTHPTGSSTAPTGPAGGTSTSG